MHWLLSIPLRFTVRKSHVCYVHYTSVQFAVHNMMRKMMLNERKKKHKYNATPLLLPPANISKGSYEGKRSGNSRRVDVLNKLFMRYITDLMTTGERSTQFFGHGIEISRVQVTPDYKAVHVYWICSDVEKERQVENNLKVIAGDLRYELANLNIIGLIPKIVFFKDKDYSKILRIDQILSIADFGEDHEPIQYKSNLKAELKLQMRLDEHTKKAISRLDNENSDCDMEQPLPDMPQNVLGLERAAILDNVLKQMKSAPTSSYVPIDVAKSSTVNESPVRFSNMKAQNEALKEFLTKRSILERKAKREKKSYQPDVEYIKEELASGSTYDSILTQKDIYLDDFMEEEDK